MNVVRSDLSYALETARRRSGRLTSVPVLEPSLGSARQASLRDLIASSGKPGGTIPIGRVDRPRRQEQVDLVLNVNEGVALFVGGIGSGKSSALRSAAVSFMACNQDGFLTSIDGGGGGLSEMLASVPLVNDIRVPSIDLHQTTLHIDRLHSILVDRATESIDQRPILLLIDHVERLISLLVSARGDRWYRKLLDIASLGRNRGIYLAMTATRQEELPVDLRALCRTLILLSPTAENFSQPADDSGESIGLGQDRFGDTVRISLLCSDGPIKITTQGLEVLVPCAQPIEAPEELPIRQDSDSYIVPIGVNEVTGGVQTIELGWRHLLIVGRPRTGKSTTLMQIANQFSHKFGQSPAIITPRKGEGLPSVPQSGIVDLPRLRAIKSRHSLANSESEIKMLNEVYGQIFRRSLQISVGGQPRHLIIVDDLHVAVRDRDFYEFLSLSVKWERACMVLASDIGATNSRDWYELKTQSSQVLYLAPSSTSEADDGSRVMGDSLRLRPSAQFSAGAGILYSHGSQAEVKTFLPRPLSPESTTSALGDDYVI